jgi:structure-specific endonuclease subunit SLX1
MSEYFVYLLESTNHNTYVGATIDLNHRLRQHNGEIKGGAVATTRKIKKGETWTRVCHIEGFPTWSEALKFEWAWKFYSRKLSKRLFPLDRRKQALNTLLSLEKSTSKAIPFVNWENPINVVWENNT